MRKLYMVLWGVLFAISGFSQNVRLLGQVRNQEDSSKVQNAVVALLIPKDSILYTFTRTDGAGKFQFLHVRPGNYILMVTHPYFADLLEPLKLHEDTSLPGIKVYSKSRLLQEVIVKTGSPFHIKGDTTVYTADSFKVSANANVEELLNKMPGIQVDKDGKITAMGQTVQTVLVDGEEFFGSDPGMAIKNLRADAVKEVQVFDKKSDQAEFTGIDDGKTQKTINLKLKENAKHGYFGKADLSAGTVQHGQNRYNENLMASSFRGNRKFSSYLLSGNTGQDGLSWQDERKYGGGSSNLDISVDDQGNLDATWVGSDDNEPYVDPQNGYMTNVNAGLLYSNKWNDKYKLNLTPTFQNQQYINDMQTLTQTQVGDSVLYENSMQTNQVNRHNFKNDVIADLQLDSANSLKLSTHINFYHTDSKSTMTSSMTGNRGVLKNTSSTQNNSVMDKQAQSGNLLFRHKFSKQRRTLSFTTNWQLISDNHNNYLKSTNIAYNQGQPSGSQLVDQHKNYQSQTNNLNGQIEYTEPLSDKYSLELAYQVAVNYGNKTQTAYSFSPATSKYDYFVDSLSNNFRQFISEQIPSARINYGGKKLKLNLGIGAGFTSFDLKDLTNSKNYIRHYSDFYPSANLTYTYKPNRTLRFIYNGNTTQPTIDQLQPLTNNNKYFSQEIGNPNLKPSFNNNFQISSYSYNFIKDLFTYLWINGNFTSNAITMNQVINLDSGKTISQPVNVNGNYNINVNGGFGYMVKKFKTRVNLFPSLTFSKYAQFVNNQESFSKNKIIGFYSGLSKSKPKSYDINIGYNLSYNLNRISPQNTLLHYLNNQWDFNATIYLHKVWSLNTEFQIMQRQRTFPGENNLNYHLWDGRLQRTFHHEEFTIYFSAHDILNQNMGIDRSYSGNTYTQVINDRLKRYFMVGFQWDFKNKTSQLKNK